MMDWIQERKNLEKLISNDVSYEEIGKKYGVTGSGVKKIAKRLGISLPKRRKINPNETFGKKQPRMMNCVHCGKEFPTHGNRARKFCCRQCSINHHNERCLSSYNRKVRDWLNGKDDGTQGFSCKKFVRRYMLEKVGYKCQLCGWNKINRHTGKTPLQIHHVDGNSLNNDEGNLQVLCPNCHSLTENFGSRNKNAPNGKSHYYGRA